MIETQVSDSDTSTDIEDNDSIGQRILPEIASTSEDSDTCDTDKMEWQENSLYRQANAIWNLEYAKLKLSKFAVNHLDCKLIIALFDTGATCSSISYHLFSKIEDKIDMTWKTLQLVEQH